MKIISQFNEDIPINNNSKKQVQELWTSRMGEICEGNKKKNIKTIVLVQPMLGSGNKHLSSSEEIILEKYGGYMIDTLNILDEISNSLIKLEKMCDETYDLRTSFDDTTESLFFDHIHVNDLGNKIIAEKIHKILENHM
jgi:lysophospholipase L1-like esterase